jgi:hypothetical protein
MSDEEQINKKIREAAENYQPAYSDNAWKGMERLLDEHLPQKKDRRRIVFLLLLVLIPSAAVYFGIQYKNAGSVLTSQKAKSVNQSTILPDNRSKKTIPSNSTNNISAYSINKILTNPLQYNLPVKSTLDSRTSKLSPELFNYEENADQSSKNIITTAESNRSIVKTEETPLNIASKEGAILGTDVNSIGASAQHDIVLENEKAENKKANASKDSSGKKEFAKKKAYAAQFAQNFSIGVVTGPEVSGVKLENAGKLTFIIGAQVGYRLSHKFTLRSGFLIGKKIYSANADEYHFQSYTSSNDYLQTVGANCTVFEVPLTVSYNFGKSKKHEWFASVGLSSYFMKKESYEYFYKYPSGNTDTKYYSVSNKNKHYFSVVDLSAGYAYAINKGISFSAEPYLKLPVTGIGVGKIKLNSAGVLFSINVRPF